MANVSELFFNPANINRPPTVDLANLALERDQAMIDATLGQSLISRDFRTRTIPEIVNRRAAQGGFYAGHTTRELGQAQEDASRQVGGIQKNLGQTMLDVLRNQFGTSIGLQL